MDGLRNQLLDGLPARVRGIADEMVYEWERAVEAVPALAPAATAEVIALLRLEPDERATCLRRRWERREREIELRGAPEPLRSVDLQAS